MNLFGDIEWKFNAINFEDFVNNKDKSTEYLLSISKKIDVEFTEVLEYFMQASHVGLTNMPDYSVCPLLLHAMNNFRFRYFVLSCSEGYVLVPLRLIDPINKKQAKRHFSLSYIVLSDFAMREDIMKEIMSYPIDLYDITHTSTKNTVNLNFFNTKREFEDMKRGAWRSKKGINTLSRHIYSKEVNQSEAIKLLKDIAIIQKEWADAKNGISSSGKAALNLLAMAHPNKIVIGYFAKDTNKIIGFQIIEKLNNCACVHMSKSIVHNSLEHNATHYFGGDIEASTLSSKYLGNFMIFELHRICFEHNLDAVYYFGARKLDYKHRNLIAFKEKFFQWKIFYNQYKHNNIK